MNQLEAVQAVGRCLTEAENLLSSTSGADVETARERLSRWRDRTIATLATQVSEAESQRFKEKRMGGFVIGDPWRNLDDEMAMYRGFLRSLFEELKLHPDAIRARQPTESGVSQSENSSPRPDCVFLVHGHDELNLLRLKEHLRDQRGLRPKVLAAMAGRGRTLIEKFEEEAREASFAFCLITPDDLVSTAMGEHAQARPNVLFELGWFYGRLGRDRVCILFKKGTSIHSDLDGVSRIEFVSSVSEQFDAVERELASAGIATGKRLRSGAGTDRVHG